MSTLQVANVHLESTGNNRIQYAGSNTVSVYTAGAERMRIDNAGTTTFGNGCSDITIGSILDTTLITLNTGGGYVEIPGPGLYIKNGSLLIGDLGAGQIYMQNGSVAFFTSGEGIQFNAGSSSLGTPSLNTLSDYEEGTWTPVVADALSAGNIATTTGAYGYYIKVGSMVMLTLSISNITTTGLTAANDLHIRGLPYTARSLVGAVYFQGACSVGPSTITSNPALALLDNTNYIRLSKSPFNFMLVNEFTSGTADIYGTVMYQAA